MKYILLLLTALAFPMFGNAEDVYELVCDQPVYNFGHVDQSAVITNVFTIRKVDKYKALGVYDLNRDIHFSLTFVYTLLKTTGGLQ